MRKIVASKMTKIGQLVYVKWIDINNEGCTWGPTSHLVGEKTEDLLKSCLRMRVDEKEVAEKKKIYASLGLRSFQYPAYTGFKSA